jgi:hypothetical protein
VSAATAPAGAASVSSAGLRGGVARLRERSRHRRLAAALRAHARAERSRQLRSGVVVFAQLRAANATCAAVAARLADRGRPFDAADLGRLEALLEECPSSRPLERSRAAARLGALLDELAGEARG